MDKQNVSQPARVAMRQSFQPQVDNRSRSSQLPILTPFPVGQTLAHSLLEAAVAQGRLATTYLFTGRTGVGKATAARWLAAQILWSQKRADAKFSREAFVSQIGSGNYPDLIWVEPTYLVNGTLKPTSLMTVAQSADLKAQVRMEQAVQLRQQLQESPIGQRWVAVINGVDRLTNEAGNALLKLLEDHSSCTFILVSSNLDQVLPTIRSRAQIVPFLPLSELECHRVAIQSCPRLEEHPILLKFASGAPGLAIRSYLWFCAIPVEVKTQFAQFVPASPAAGVLLGLKLARSLGSLPVKVQRLLLLYLQFCFWQQDVCPLSVRQSLLGLTEQAIGLLDQRVQPQSVWELLLCQCAMQGMSWNLDLPNNTPDGCPQTADVDQALVEEASSASTPHSTTAHSPAVLNPVPLSLTRSAEVSQLTMF